MYYIGVMSGTSLDGIDAVLVKDKNGKLEVINTITRKFPDDLKSDLETLLVDFTVHLKKLGEIEVYLSRCYADCINELINVAKISKDEIKAVGCHGQTVFHSPREKYSFTMQLVDGNIVALNTSIPTVVDFRRMDMALGGDGAPLAPAFHQDYLKSNYENRVILNLGGIANITVLDNKGENVIGFDNGPANCLMDLWIQKCKSLKYDKNGDWAKSGKINEKLLIELLNEEYLNLEPPKSTGKELFNLQWLEDKLSCFVSIKQENVQATLCELTAITIANDIKKFCPDINAVYSCGGGAFNIFLHERLSELLPNVKISSTQELGIDPLWVEAIAFAWLAKQRVEKKTGNLPSVTGAKEKAMLGTIYVKN